jgi:hypothetical protein
MASEWVKLTLQDGGKAIHVNLANVSSIECDEKGSVIWFLAGVGEDGKARVLETVEVILKRLSKVQFA